MENIQPIIAKYIEKQGLSGLLGEGYLREFASEVYKKVLKQMERELLEIADKGEFEELRREVMNYFKTNK